MSTEITTTETVSTETPATPAITRAAERYLEQYGDPLVMNTYLKVTILVLDRRLSRAGRAHLQEPERARQHAPHDRAD